MGNYKASATAQFLAESLALRTSLAAVVDESGADPIVTLGTATAGSVGCTIKVLDQRGGDAASWQALPGFGTVDQPVYTGTVIRFVVENNNGPALFHFGFANLMAVIGDAVRRGARVELYTVDHGQNPIFTGPPAGYVLAASFDPNLNWPLSDRV